MTFDNLVNTCLDYAAVSDRSDYSTITSLDGFCSSVGDVEGAGGGGAVSGGLASLTVPPSAAAQTTGLVVVVPHSDSSKTGGGFAIGGGGGGEQASTAVPTTSPMASGSSTPMPTAQKTGTGAGLRVSTHLSHKR